MKKSDLKHLIKECVKEVLFEDGVLAGLVTEVMVGVTKAQMLTENVEKPVPKQDIQKQQANERKKINETRKRMAEAMGQDAYKGVFKDVEPIRESSVGQHSPLANSDPSDAGVNINGIMSIAGNAWERLK
tara:strand:+ start:155 stop:544 length:390 start_codon:yes stop_codon:yes gene_type:complete